jgi:hypothetical protein
LIDELASFRGAIGSRRKFFPFDLHARSVDHAEYGRGHFRADAFARDQGDFVPHGCIVL